MNKKVKKSSKKKGNKRYIVNFDKAFSLNPRVVIENVNKMLSEGKVLEDVRKDMIENASRLF